MLLFIDIETTGLSPEQDVPLEVGLILTDDRLNEIARRSWICSVYNFDYMPHDPFVQEMHTKNGLLGELRVARKVYPSFSFIDDEMCDWLFTFTDVQLLHPAGSSVHFDVDFIRRRFPRLANHLHHRHFDVSSIKMMYPAVGLEYDKGPEDVHRALSDLDNDLAWIKHFLYKTAAFFPRSEIGTLSGDS